MAALQIHLIPAQPAVFTVYDLDDEKRIILGEPVIAWRIETASDQKGDFYSSCIAITVDGDAASNCIGVQNQDMTVTVFEESSYKSLTELREHRYPKK